MESGANDREPEDPCAETPAEREAAPGDGRRGGRRSASPPRADDANDLRGFHFKQLLGQVSTWVIIAILAVAAGVGGAIYDASVALGGGAALAVLVLAMIAVLAIADSRAADAFFATTRRRTASPSAAGPSCRGRRRCCARATTATPSAR